MSQRIDRFRTRKEKISKNKSTPLIRSVVDQKLVNDLLNTGVDSQRLSNLDYSTGINPSSNADPIEIEKLLLDLRASFRSERLDQLIVEIKEGVISSIAGPFGLGKMISAYDKVGGNVDTVHNVRNGIYATTKEEKRYDDRGNYNSSNFHGHELYKKKNKEDSRLQENGSLIDSYTGNLLKANSKRQLDHTISASEIHNDRGRVLAESDGPGAANSKFNLNSTSEHINNKSGKGASTSNEFLDKLDRTDRERKARIQELSKKKILDSKESRELERLSEHDAVDADRMRRVDENAREQYNSQINKKYYTSKKFAQSTLSTGAKEGLKMGVQQAFGQILLEFFSNAIVEIKDAYENGLEGDSLHKDIKVRLTRVCRNVSNKWKGIVKGFSTGFISGFLSNLITTLVNVFASTAKRFVRMVREGVFSLLKALKLVLFPPSDISFVEAMHEAMKLLAVGGVIVTGVTLEEIVEKLVLSVPFLAPFASVATAAITGSLTAIAMSLVAYLIDKMDILSVVETQETKFVLNNLDNNIEGRLERCEQISEEIDYFLDEDQFQLS